MNPFHYVMDAAFRGARVRVYSGERTYEGLLDRALHGQGSVLLHDAVLLDDDGEEVEVGSGPGSVFVRVVDAIVALDSHKDVRVVDVGAIEPSPHLEWEFEIVDDHMRSAYRDGFTGSFPVVRPLGGDGDRWELINGHKRVAAAQAVGLETHPVEVIDVDDDLARELFELAHREKTSQDDDE